MNKLIILILSIVSTVALGQSHTMNFINIGGPGGAADVFIDIYKPCLAANNINVQKEFKPGADGLLGVQELLNSKDTDTLTNVLTGGAGILMTNKYTTVNIAESLQPIIYLGKIEMVLVTRTGGPINSIEDLKRLGKTKSINVGTGTGVLPFILKEWLTGLGVNYTVIPYKSTSQSYIDTVNGNLDISISLFIDSLGLVDGGKMKILTSTLPPAIAAKYNHLPIEHYLGPDNSNLIPIGTLLTFKSNAQKKHVEMIKAAVQLCHKDPEIIAKLASHNTAPITMSTEEINRILTRYRREHQND